MMAKKTIQTNVFKMTGISSAIALALLAPNLAFAQYISAAPSSTDMLLGLAASTKNLTTKSLLIQATYSLSAEAIDIDGDGYPEALPALTGGGGPTGGGQIPTLSGAPKTDYYGSKVGYCSYDLGSTNVSTGRVSVAGPWSNAQPVFAVISSGPDGVFQTTCSSLLTGAASGDDISMAISVSQVKQGMGVGSFLGSPVANATDLAALATSTLQDGEVRLQKDTNQLVRWDAASGTWKPVTAASGGGAGSFTTAGNDIYYTTGNAGFGIAPTARLQVGNGDMRVGNGNFATPLVAGDMKAANASSRIVFDNSYTDYGVATPNKIVFSSTGTQEYGLGYARDGSSIYSALYQHAFYGNGALYGAIRDVGTDFYNQNLSVGSSTGGYLYLKGTTYAGGWKVIGPTWVESINNLGIKTGGDILAGTSFQLVDANTKLSRGTANTLRVSTGTGYVDVGSTVAGQADLQTDQAKFVMNKPVDINGTVRSLAASTVPAFQFGTGTYAKSDGTNVTWVLGGAGVDKSFNLSGFTSLTAGGTTIWDSTNGVAGQFAASGGNLTYSTGNVGVGIAPTSRFQVGNGDIRLGLGTFEAGAAVGTSRVATGSTRLVFDNSYTAVNSQPNKVIFYSADGIVSGVGVDSTFTTNFQGGSNGFAFYTGTTSAAAGTKTFSIAPGVGTFSGSVVAGTDYKIVDANTKLSRGTANMLRVSTGTGYVDIGSTVAGQADIQTDRAKFVFNKSADFGTNSITADSLVSSANGAYVLQPGNYSNIFMLTAAGYYTKQNYSDDCGPARCEISYNLTKYDVDVPRNGIYREGGTWVSNPSLRFVFQSGIKMGAESAKGGIKFYNSSDIPNATQVFSIADTDNNIRAYSTIKSMVGSTTPALQFGNGTYVKSDGTNVTWVMNGAGTDKSFNLTGFTSLVAGGTTIWDSTNGLAGGSPFTKTGANLSYTAGNLGLGVATPTARLQVGAGDVRLGTGNFQTTTITGDMKAYDAPSRLVFDNSYVDYGMSNPNKIVIASDGTTDYGIGYGRDGRFYFQTPATYTFYGLGGQYLHIDDTSLTAWSGNIISYIGSGQGGALTLGGLSTNTKLTSGTASSLRITSATGYVDIGSTAAGQASISTDRAKFVINKPVDFSTGGAIVGGTLAINSGWSSTTGESGLVVTASQPGTVYRENDAGNSAWRTSVENDVFNISKATGTNGTDWVSKVQITNTGRIWSAANNAGAGGYLN